MSILYIVCATRRMRDFHYQLPKLSDLNLNRLAGRSLSQVWKSCQKSLVLLVDIVALPYGWTISIATRCRTQQAESSSSSSSFCLRLSALACSYDKMLIRWQNVLAGNGVGRRLEAARRQSMKVIKSSCTLRLNPFVKLSVHLNALKTGVQRGVCNGQEAAINQRHYDLLLNGLMQSRKVKNKEKAEWAALRTMKFILYFHIAFPFTCSLI